MNKEIIENIAKIKAIRFVDDSEYRPEMSCNGGAYRFWTEYVRISADAWKRQEGTSGEFCPYCFSWDCNGQCQPESEDFSTEAVISFIKNFEEDDSHYIVAYMRDV